MANSNPTDVLGQYAKKLTSREFGLLGFVAYLSWLVVNQGIETGSLPLVKYGLLAAVSGGAVFTIMRILQKIAELKYGSTNVTATLEVLPPTTGTPPS